MVDLNNMITNLVLQYGLAGLVIWVFYKLFSNELKSLRREIRELRHVIEKLVEKLS